MAEKKERQYVSDNARLMAEWDWEKNRMLDLDPYQLSTNSHKKAYWRCSKGHGFQAAISNRNRGSQCTVCLNRVIVPGVNDLQTLNPDLANQWHPTKNGNLLPTMVARSANITVWWQCPEAHEYQATINHRSNGNGCPVCAGKKVVAGYNDIASKYPEIVTEWDFERNEVFPSEITQGSQLRVWWKCKKCGHGWKTSVSNRVRGTGCPICAKKEAGRKHSVTTILTTGSLLDNAPEIAAEWHPTKNGALQPTDFHINSETRIWWCCSKCGREWITAIKNRTGGSGCPNCRNDKFAKAYRAKVIKKTGSLLDTEPEIAAEWHPNKNKDEKPCDYSPRSGKNVWWQCSAGHEWQAVIYTRTGERTGCPVCGGRIPVKGINDLATTHPSIAEEWHPTKNGELKPEDVKIGSDKIVWWKCRKGHEWKTNIYHRKENGCTECIKEQFTSFPEQAIYYYLKKDFPDAQNRYMLDDAIELDIYLPNQQLAIEYDGSRFHNTSAGLKRDQRKYAYLQKLGIYLIRIKESKKETYLEGVADVCLGYEDNKSNRNLPRILDDLQQELSTYLGIQLNWDVDLIRDRQKIYMQYLEQERENSIAEQYPHLLEEWIYEKNHPITPSMVTKGSEKVFWWRCIKGHEYQAPVNRRMKSGCPYCANIKVLPGYNDLATTHPNLAREWIIAKNNGIDPSSIIGAKQIVWWRCREGHEWQASIDSRKRGNGCPICAGKQVLIGFNDLATINPAVAAEWNCEKNENFYPTEVVPGSNQSVWWRCSKGHEWQAIISSRTRANGNGCPYCSNQRVLEGYNDLQTMNPKIAAEWNYAKNEGLSPTQVVSGSAKSVWWICAEGHEWKAAINYRTSRQKKCPRCAKRV